jgi:zinc transport system substrate-binding protein
MKLRVAPLLGTVAALAAATGLLTGCGSDESGGSGGGDGRLSLVASFYPLQFATQRVAGDRADVTSLTPPGAEPHDLELTPKDVAAVSEADLVVYLKGFQASVDDAVADQAGDDSLDVTSAARLDLAAPPEEEHAEEGAEEEHADEAGGAGKDPHFWLDPSRLSAVTGIIADRLAAADPDGAATYRANAKALQEELTGLDTEYRTGLANCASKDLVTSHQAFGYLAERYGLTQVGITGLSPDTEPQPADLARVTDFVREHKVRTIYYETLVSPAIARTVAAETGARTAVLDPIEGLTKDSAGGDYLAVMRSNLQHLREGQPCT